MLLWMSPKPKSAWYYCPIERTLILSLLCNKLCSNVFAIWKIIPQHSEGQLVKGRRLIILAKYPNTCQCRYTKKMSYPIDWYPVFISWYVSYWPIFLTSSKLCSSVYMFSLINYQLSNTLRCESSHSIYSTIIEPHGQNISILILTYQMLLFHF